MQLGIENEEAEKLAENHGIDVVENKCIYVEHKRLINTNNQLSHENKNYPSIKKNLSRQRALDEF